MQERPPGLVAALVPATVAERARLGERILADVRAAASRADPGLGGRPGPFVDDGEERRLVETALGWILDRLAADGVVDVGALEPLRDAGAAAARRGEPVARPLDRVLSAGWVIWEATVRGVIADGAALAALGDALLRLGDAAAAAIAAGHAEAEREAAARAAAARRELLDEILDLPAGDPDAATRIASRAVALGLDPDTTYDVLVADVGRDLGDEDPELGRLVAIGDLAGRRFVGSQADGRGAGWARRTAVPVAGTRTGRLLVLAETRWAGWSGLLEGLPALARGGDWVAVRARRVEGLVAVGGAAGAAMVTLRTARRLGLRGQVVEPPSLALERLVLADEVLAGEAVAGELGALLADRRMGSALVETLAAYLASRGNARATARRLGLAPRTVAYRLERVRQLLGRPLEGEAFLRLAAALFVSRVLAGPREPSSSPPRPPLPATAPPPGPPVSPSRRPGPTARVGTPKRRSADGSHPHRPSSPGTG